MIARNETDPVAWYRPVLVTKSVVLGGPTTTSTIYGAPTRSEAKARACAARIGRALLSAKCDGRWSVGVGRSFNRSSTPSVHVLSPEGEVRLEPFPALPPLKGPTRAP